jgi:hypothetical protein
MLFEIGARVEERIVFPRDFLEQAGRSNRLRSVHMVGLVIRFEKELAAWSQHSGKEAQIC